MSGHDDIVIEAIERKYMDVAFEHAELALKKQEVPVGCIFVYNDEIITVGSNTVNKTKNATRHAEINCIDEVIDYWRKLQGKVDLSDIFGNVYVYVTVEPCIMCMDALYDLKVKQITYSCKNDRFGGRTVFDISRVKNVVTRIKTGYRTEEAMELLKEFYKGTNPNAPQYKVKMKKET